MKSIRKQSGLTIWGLIYHLSVLGFVAICIFKIGPLYLNEFFVQRALQDVVTNLNKNGLQAGKTSLGYDLQKRWDVDYIKDLKPSEVVIIQEPGGTFLSYDYDAQAELFGSIFVVVNFKKKMLIHTAQTIG